MIKIDVVGLMEEANRQQRTMAIGLGLVGLVIWIVIAALGWGFGWLLAWYLAEEDGRERPLWPWIGLGVGLMIFVPSFIRFMLNSDEQIESPDEFAASDSIFQRHDRVAGEVGFAMLEMAPKLTAEAILALKRRARLEPDELQAAERITSELYRLNDWVPPSRYAADLAVVSKLIKSDILRTKETPRGIRMRLNPSHMD